VNQGKSDRFRSVENQLEQIPTIRSGLKPRIKGHFVKIPDLNWKSSWR